MQLKPGSTLQNGKYEIIKVLGQGGFGITYLAKHTVIDRQVCIKEFFVQDFCDRDEESSQVSLGSRANSDMMHQYMRKFIKEAQTVAKMEHPRIVKIYDTFYENNTAYSVMELIDGCSLAEWVKEHGPLPEAQAVNYIRQVGAALGYAHAQRVMHLDVKPSNIMLSERGTKATLIDFGMAKQYTETGEQTSSTPVGVSHGYAPLEQYQEGGVKGFSPATDIYSLGATLYFALTGKRPPQATEVAMMGGLKSVDGDFSPAIKQAILKAMRFQKDERPQRVEDFLMMLYAPVSKSKLQPASPAPVDPEKTVIVPKGTPQTAQRPQQRTTSQVQPHQRLQPTPRQTPPPATALHVSQPPKKKSKVWLWVLLGCAAAAALLIMLLVIIGLVSGGGMSAPPVDEEQYAVEAIAETDSCVAVPPVEEVVKEPAKKPEPAKKSEPVTKNEPATKTEPAKEPAKKPEPVTYGSIRVTSTPSGATILMDGTNTMKKTPATIEGVLPGYYGLKLILDGYENYAGAVTVVAGQRAEFSPKLTPKEKPNSGSVQSSK